MPGYLTWLNARLLEMKRLLKPTGSICVHLDWHASHYVKIEMDKIFGYECFRNEIVWHYTGGGRSKKYFSKKHDILLWYSYGQFWTFNIDTIRIPYKETSGYARGGIVSAAGKHYTPNSKGTPIDDVWDIPIINPLAHERLGYPTQKPEVLLERIIGVSSNENDIVFDPYMGSGSVALSAQILGRKWFGCELEPKYCAIAEARIAAERRQLKLF